MPRFVRRSPMPVSAEALFAWHERPGAFERLARPWQSVRLDAFEGIHNGDRAVIRMGPPPFCVRWVARHRGYVYARQFRDEQVEGPFASWVHTHRMIPEDEQRSALEDDVVYRLPFAALSQRLVGSLAEAQLDRVFAYRHRVTATDLARHAAARLPPFCVAITGSSGLLGSALTAFLRTGGHRVVRVVRHAEAASTDTIRWDPDHGSIDERALAEAEPDVVIHLAGEPVYAPYWTVEKRRRIWESRTRGTQLLSRALARMERRPEVFLSASGSGYYGDGGSRPLTESDGPGSTFLAAVCRAWEASTRAAEDAGIRTVHLRIGAVLTPAGGALRLLLPFFQAGLGAYMGPGAGYLPWLALDDVLYAILHLMKSDLAGPVNLGTPHPVTFKAFADTLAGTLRRPRLARVPASLLTLLGGDAAREIVGPSLRMRPDRITRDGFSFAYPTLDAALGHVLGTSTAYPSAP